MCKSISKVLRKIPSKIAEISELDLHAAKAALTWVRLSLIPHMSVTELKEFQVRLKEMSQDIQNRIEKGVTYNG